MATTPSLAHFTFRDFDEFYEPNEDTFLLLDALAADLPTAVAGHAACLCVELG